MNTVALVKFCALGEHVYCFPIPEEGCGQFDIRGYGTPERPHAAIPGNTLAIPRNTPVIDIRDAVFHDAGFKWVFNGPMLKPGIERGYMQRLGSGTMKHDQDNPPGGLDFVGVEDFYEGWKQHGARVGHYDANGVIVWDDENTIKRDWRSER